ARTRLLRSVGPPRDHHRMWCALVNRRVPHPGNRHSPSRWRSVRIIAGEGSLELRPRRRGFPPESSITICGLPEHKRRLAVSAWVPPPPSTSHPPSPLTTSSSRACTTTVAPPGLVSEALARDRKSTRLNSSPQI